MPFVWLPSRVEILYQKLANVTRYGRDNARASLKIGDVEKLDITSDSVDEQQVPEQDEKCDLARDQNEQKCRVPTIQEIVQVQD